MTDGDVRLLVAAPDVDEFFRSWSADGVLITATELDGSPFVDTATPVTESAAWNDCDLVRGAEYDDGMYVGDIFYLDDCGGTGTTAVVISATTAGKTVHVLVEVQQTSPDETVVEDIIASFVV